MGRLVETRFSMLFVGFGNIVKPLSKARSAVDSTSTTSSSKVQEAVLPLSSSVSRVTVYVPIVS